MNWLKVAQDIILMVLQILIFPLVAYGLNVLKDYLQSKIKIEKGRDILERAYDAVSVSVGFVAQTFVDDVKGTDEWNSEKMKEAAELALTTAKNLLGKDALKILKDIVDNIDEWLMVAIEDEVILRKTAK